MSVIVVYHIFYFPLYSARVVSGMYRNYEELSLCTAVVVRN